MTSGAMLRAIVVLAAIIGTLARPLPVRAEDDERHGTGSIVWENDIVSGFDRDYTNGALLSWTSAKGDVPDWVVGSSQRLGLFSDTTELRVNYALGQSIYTPNDIRLVNPPLDDRPYAGWLYASVGLAGHTGAQATGDRAWLDQLQLQVGVVGPASFAEEMQEFVHKAIDADDPQGWHTQLRNEPGVVLTYQRSVRAIERKELGWLDLDATPHFGGAIGNVFTYANAGATFRLGWHLPKNDYGPPRVQPSLPGSGFFDPTEPFSIYAFAGFDGRAVLRNIFLDGNSFRESRSVDKNPFVGDVQAGLAIKFGLVRLTYTHVFRTREFEGQQGADRFGALTMSVYCPL